MALILSGEKAPITVILSSGPGRSASTSPSDCLILKK
jgi:hypothetical protein